MEKKDKDYHVQISTDLLFNRKFKSPFTIWVYAKLKLKHNYHLEHKPNYEFKIDHEEIQDFFNITKPTFHRTLKELQELGLIERVSRNSYNLKNDMAGDKKFIKIYNNFFKDLFQRLRYHDWGHNNRASGKLPMVYYYLLFQNGHHVSSENKMESNETKARLSKHFKIDFRTMDKILGVIWGLDLINIEGSKIYTYSNTQPMKKRMHHYTKDEPIIKEPEYAYREEEQNKDKEVGYIKSKDGTRYIRLIKMEGHGIVRDGSKPADGIPPTEQEKEEARILEYGYM